MFFIFRNLISSSLLERLQNSFVITLGLFYAMGLMPVQESQSFGSNNPS